MPTEAHNKPARRIPVPHLTSETLDRVPPRANDGHACGEPHETSFDRCRVIHLFSHIVVLLLPPGRSLNAESRLTTRTSSRTPHPRKLARRLASDAAVFDRDQKEHKERQMHGLERSVRHIEQAYRQHER